MLVVIIEQPPQSFVDSHDVVMQIVEPSSMIVVELFIELLDKRFILLQIV